MNAQVITEAYTKFIETEEGRAAAIARQYVYASSWSACTRQMALEMLRPDVKAPFRTDTLANFRRGNDRARDLKADFTRVGRYSDPPFDVVGAEDRFELKDKKGRVAIVGKVDFRLQFKGQKTAAPAEVKSFHPNLTQNIKTFSDLFGNRWLRKGAFQLLAYLLATNEPTGFMILDRPGLPRILEVSLYDHLDKAEDFLNRAEIAQDARIDSITHSDMDDFLPPFIDAPEECRMCAFFGSACNPPIKYEGADIITEESILAEIAQHESLKPAQKEYNSSHDYLKDVLQEMTSKSFKGGTKKQIVAGEYMIEASWGKQTSFEVPAAIKTQYQKTDDAGRFQFTITKVNP